MQIFNSYNLIIFQNKFTSNESSFHSVQIHVSESSVIIHWPKFTMAFRFRRSAQSECIPLFLHSRRSNTHVDLVDCTPIGNEYWINSMYRLHDKRKWSCWNIQRINHKVFVFIFVRRNVPSDSLRIDTIFSSLYRIILLIDRLIHLKSKESWLI